MQRLNKQVLNGFIQQAISHNKYLEEQEMWKKKESSESKKRKRGHKSREKMPRVKSPTPSDDEVKEAPKSNRTPEELDDLKAILALYKSAKESNNEKWNHSGFKELYPDFKSDLSEKKKMSIDDALEAINEQNQKKNKHKSNKSKKKKKKSKKHKSNENFSSNDELTDSSSVKSDEFRKLGRRKKKKKDKN